jgi:hypothetical protein
MKSYKKKVSKKKHTANARIHDENDHDASHKVHHVDSKVKNMGRQQKVMRINQKGSGLAKWMLK